MGKAYSIDLREKVLQAVDMKIYSLEEIANLFNVSKRWIYKLIKQRYETGSIAPLGHGGGREAIFQGEMLENLKDLVNSEPDLTLLEILEKTGVVASQMSVHRALKRIDFRRKKNSPGVRTRAS